MKRLALVLLLLIALVGAVLLRGEAPPTAADASLETDVAQIDWGHLLPGVNKWLAGDLIWDDPPGDKPTVRNDGVTPAYLCLSFSKMAGQFMHREITQFDAKFLGETIDPIAASTQVCFTNPLGPGESAKLDLSVHPGVPLPEDIYWGTADVAGTVMSTHAEITSVGDPPIVEWKWELPDMDSTTLGMQYTSPGDDEPLVSPTAPPTGHHMMQVTPNLDDLPEVHKVEYWAAAEDPNGLADIIDVYVSVYHPDGSVKYQLHLASAVCDEAHLGNWNVPGTVLGAAHETGQMTDAEAQHILSQCDSNAKGVWHVVGEVSSYQPCGEYRVEMTAVDKEGSLGTMTNWFDVPCASVGGIADLPDASGSTGLNYMAVVAPAAAALLALTAGGWYARRRSLR